MKHPITPLRWRLAVGAGLALFALAASAQVSVSDAWARATVPGQHAAGAFMKLVSARDARLVGASSAVAKAVEVHEMKLEGGVMTMRAVDKLALPAGKPVALTPGGYHVMLMGLAQPLHEGDSVAITLVVEDASGKREDVHVVAKVRGVAAPAPK